MIVHPLRIATKRLHRSGRPARVKRKARYPEAALRLRDREIVSGMLPNLLVHSADEPERLRGPQHDAAYCDEVAAWRYPEAYDQLLFGLRLGNDPRVVVTTTPKPVKIIRELMADPTTVITRGSSYANRENLPAAFFAQIIKRYEGTRLGRQEINAELLDDVPGALWTRELLEEQRWPAGRSLPDLSRVVVAIDPAVTSGEDADETGIIVAGRDYQGRGYVLDDRSGRYAPIEWAREAVMLYQKFGADRVVAEVNNGGDMVEATLRMVDENVSFNAVRASRGKVVRAEPVAALYEHFGADGAAGAIHRRRTRRRRRPVHAPSLRGARRERAGADLDPDQGRPCSEESRRRQARQSASR
jgi:phage terminase large subunit-like protein